MFRVFHLLDEKKKQRSDVKRLPLFVKTAIYNQKKSRPTGGFFFWQREAGEIRTGHEQRERNMPGACFDARVRAGAAPASGESLRLRQSEKPADRIF